METKKIQFIIGLLGVLVILMAILYYSLRGRNTTQPQIVPTPTTGYNSPTRIPITSFDYKLGKSVAQVPTLRPTEGYGLNLNSPEIKSSIRELDKITGDLPYVKKITTSQKLDVKILIPERNLMENQWTLTAHVYGVDFEIPETAVDYERNRRSFLEAAQEIYFWLKNEGVDTEKIIIKWGDKAYVQDKAELWLQ